MGEAVRLGARLQARDEGSVYRRVEVITGRRQRRSWSAAEKARIVAESAEPGANVSDVARRHGVNRGLLGVWRREAGVIRGRGPRFVPLTVETGAAPRPTTGGPQGVVEVDLRAGRVHFAGAVDPGMVQAVLSALRGTG